MPPANTLYKGLFQMIRLAWEGLGLELYWANGS